MANTPWIERTQYELNKHSNFETRRNTQRKNKQQQDFQFSFFFQKSLNLQPEMLYFTLVLALI